MERLLAQTHQIRSDSIVYNSILGDLAQLARDVKQPVSLKLKDYYIVLYDNWVSLQIIYTYRCYNQTHHTGSVKRPVNKVSLENVGREYQSLQKVAISCTGKRTRRHVQICTKMTYMIVKDVISVFFDEPFEDDKRGRPVFESLVLVDDPIVVFVEAAFSVFVLTLVVLDVTAYCCNARKFVDGLGIVENS